MIPRFRVWDGEEMHEPPHDWMLTYDGQLYCPDEQKYYSTGFSRPVMLYTGLDDAEGTPIYESDIIKTKWNGGIYGVVEYGLGEFRAEYVQSSDVLYDAVSNGQGLVVGNEYQNPELLDEVSA